MRRAEQVVATEIRDAYNIFSGKRELYISSPPWRLHGVTGQLYCFINTPPRADQI
jgi:hypothetical protein